MSRRHNKKYELSLKQKQQKLREYVSIETQKEPKEIVEENNDDKTTIRYVDDKKVVCRNEEENEAIDKKLICQKELENMDKVHAITWYSYLMSFIY